MGVVLGDDDIERFVTSGYIRLDRAFDPDLAARCVDESRSMLPIDRDGRTGWTQPVMRIPGSAHPSLVAAINTATGRSDQRRHRRPGRMAATVARLWHRSRQIPQRR